MAGRRLILADGSVIENGEAGQSGNVLWLWLPDFTMQKAVKIAFNPEALRRIAFQYGNMEDVYTGYTMCMNIAQQDSMVSVCLGREGD